jgi:hypothetical protein
MVKSMVSYISAQKPAHRAAHVTARTCNQPSRSFQYPYFRIKCMSLKTTVEERFGNLGKGWVLRSRGLGGLFTSFCIFQM